MPTTLYLSSKQAKTIASLYEALDPKALKAGPDFMNGLSVIPTIASDVAQFVATDRYTAVVFNAKLAEDAGDFKPFTLTADQCKLIKRAKYDFTISSGDDGVRVDTDAGSLFALHIDATKGNATSTHLGIKVAELVESVAQDRGGLEVAPLIDLTRVARLAKVTDKWTMRCPGDISPVVFSAEDLTAMVQPNRKP